METVLAGGVLSEDSNANVALFIRLVPRSPVRTVASRLLVGLHRGQVQPRVRFVRLPRSITTSSLSVPLSCPFSSVMFPE